MQCSEDPPLPDPAASNVSGWVIAALVIGVIVYEWWAYRTKRPTISQWLKRHTSRRPWWKVFAGAVIGLTLLHLLFGGPI